MKGDAMKNYLYRLMAAVALAAFGFSAVSCDEGFFERKGKRIDQELEKADEATDPK
jgi:hypothetical protein